MNIEHVREFNNNLLDLADHGLNQVIEGYKKTIDESEKEISKRLFTDFFRTLFINLPKMIISGLLNIGHLTNYEVYSTKEMFRGRVEACKVAITFINHVIDVFAIIRNTINMNDELSMEFYHNISANINEGNPLRIVLRSYYSVCEQNGLEKTKVHSSYETGAWSFIRSNWLGPKKEFGPMLEYAEKEFSMSLERNIRRVKCPNCGVINKITNINCFACNHQLE